MSVNSQAVLVAGALAASTLVVSDAVWMALIAAVATLLTLVLKMVFRAYVAHRRENSETDEARDAWGEADDLDEKAKRR